MHHRLALFLALTCFALGARAQTPAPEPTPTPSASPAAAASPALSASQAQAVLDVLRDDKRRAEFTATLEGMARALPAPEAPAPVLPLEPDSLGAQLLTQVSTTLSNAGTQLAASVQAVNDLPLLWRWLALQATDPAARARVLDAAWKLAVVLALALTLEWLAVRVLRRLRAAFNGWAPRAQPDEAKPDADETEAAHRSWRLAVTVGALRRLPYLLGRLLLDLAPIAVFAAAAYVLINTRLGDAIISRQAITLVVQGYIATRAVLAVVWMLVGPDTPQLRLLHVSNRAAAYLTRWAWRIMVIAVTGYVIAEIGLLFGMYRTAHDAVLKLFALVVHGCLVIMVLQARPAVARRIRAAGKQTGFWAAVRNRMASSWHLVAIFYIVALWLVWAVELRNGYMRLLQFFVVTSVVLLASRLLTTVVLGGLDRLRTEPENQPPRLGSRLRFYYPIVRGILLAGLMVLTGFALLEAWGLGAWSWLMRGGLGGRVASAMTLIGFTVVLAILVWEGANAWIEAHLARLTHEAHLARAGRLRTLLPMLRTALLVTIVLVVALMTLSELGVNIAPLLAGAGVIGIAVGFGSQKLVQDLITGMFLLLENTMQVGDVVTLGGLTGTVETLSIRAIRLRALDGAVHIIPFSAVTTVTNQTRDYGYALLDISVGLNEEPGRVGDVLRGLAAEMRADPAWATKILDALDVMGVERFIDTAWVLRVRMKTQPASRWAVGRELNRRVKLRFDELAIESPITSYRALSTPEPALVQEKAA